MIMIFIKTTIPYFWIKSKIYFEKAPVVTNNALALTSGFINIYNLCKHSSKKILG